MFGLSEILSVKKLEHDTEKNGYFFKYKIHEYNL